MEFSRQEYWSGLPFPSPGDLPNRETVPGSPALKADSLPSELPGKPKRGVSVQSQNPSQSVGDCGAGSEPRDEGLLLSKTWRSPKAALGRQRTNEEDQTDNDQSGEEQVKQASGRGQPAEAAAQGRFLHA